MAGDAGRRYPDTLLLVTIRKASGGPFVRQNVAGPTVRVLWRIVARPDAVMLSWVL